MTDDDKLLIREQRFARALDLRFIIALLFLIFGVLITFSGFTATNEEIERAAGINISLWTGIGCLALSSVFGIWVLRAPPELPQSIADTTDDSSTTDTPSTTDTSA